MSTLATLLRQLNQGSLSAASFRHSVQAAVAGGKLDPTALRTWLEMPTVRAALPPVLAQELAVLAQPGRPGTAVPGAAVRTGKPTPERGSAAAPRRPAAAPPTQGSGTAARAAFDVGSVIDGRYELVAHLGGGGMGEVFKALDKLAHAQRDPDPYVAIKILKPAMQSNQNAVLALQREANRARRLTHANILRVHQFERDRETGQYFMVMEHLEGRALESVMYESRNGQPWAQIAPMIAQICAGLTCAHEQGIIHSDIKPSNLFLTRRGGIKILDFGIATPVPSLSGHQTLMDARKLGARTPAYASMEIFLGSKPHYSDDVFSLACLTYEWLSARPPYAKPETPYEPVPAPAALRLSLQPAPIPALTRAQNRALRKALALRRVERTQTIDEFWRSMTEAPSPFSTRNSRIVAAVGGTVLAAVLGLLFLWLPHRTPVAGATAPDADATAGCSGPPGPITLEDTLIAARRARDRLVAQTAGSPQHAQAHAAFTRAAQCLRVLERAGLSDPRGVALLRELETLDAQ